MITDLIQNRTLNQNKLRPPIIVHETVRILDLIETLKTARGQLVIVINEFGAVEGLVTPIDVFEAIAGDFPDERSEEHPSELQSLMRTSYAALCLKKKN